jgi:hypothetical protein
MPLYHFYRKDAVTNNTGHPLRMDSRVRARHKGVLIGDSVDEIPQENPREMIQQSHKAITDKEGDRLRLASNGDGHGQILTALGGLILHGHQGPNLHLTTL